MFAFIFVEAMSKSAYEQIYSHQLCRYV